MSFDETGAPVIGEPRGEMIDDYLQPIAQHVDHPERLLLRDGEGRWFVWTGERPEEAPAEIPAATAEWLLTQAGLEVIEGPNVWIHKNDLPLLPIDVLRARQHPPPDGPNADADR
jgi:hypothetical protein